MEELISTAEFARRVEISATMVNKYIAAGKIGPDAIRENKKNPDRKQIDFIIGLQYFAIYNDIAELQYIIDNPDILQKIETYVAPVPEPKEEKGKKNKKESKKVSAEQLSILESDKRLSSAKAQLAEVNLEKALGNLLSKSEVNKALYTYGAQIRIALEAIPDRITDNVFSAQDRGEAHFILTTEIKNILIMLTKLEI